LFAGSQLVVVGRYRQGGTANVTLTGMIQGKQQTYTYKNLAFSDNAGGQAFIPRLWATRKIGTLLNAIRLNGEKPELVDSVVRLSVRYGIITPYTSYLIQEGDIKAQGGGDVGVGGAPIPVMPQPGRGVGSAPKSADHGGTGGGQAAASGAAAVDQAQSSNNMQNANQAAPAATSVAMLPSGSVQEGSKDNKGTGRVTEPIKQVNDRTFILRNGIWTDTLYTSDKMKVQQVVFLSDEYFKLLDTHPEIKDYLAIGDHVIIVIGDTAYEVKPH